MSENDYIITIRARDKTAATELFDLVADMEGVENVLITAPKTPTRVRDMAYAKAQRVINGPESFMEMLMAMAVENCASCDDKDCPNHPSQVALRKARQN